MNTAPDSTRDALYAGILAHPDEDTPRLVYADYIEEHGDAARAEFIRAQVRLAAMNEWDDGYTALDVRCRRLLAEHPEWLEAVGFSYPRTWSGEPVFRRGFAEHVGLSTESFRSDFENLFRKIPVRSAAIWASGPKQLSPGEIAGCAALGRLRRLTLQLERDAIGALADVPHLIGLERLCVRATSVDVGTLRRLVESPHLRSLRSFDVGSVDDNGPEPKPNERWKWPPDLRELVLIGSPLRLLDTGLWVAPLERLWISAGGLDSGGSVFAALTDGLLDNLADLHLSHVRARPALFAPLSELDRPALRSLRLISLTSRNAPAQRALADQLFHAPWLHDLRRLELPYADVGDAWLTSASESPFARSLRTLDLTNTRFTPTGFRVGLGPNSWWPALERLNLAAPQCPEDVLTGLIENPGMQSLVSLIAGREEPVPKFLTRLTESPASARFRELNLAVKMDDATAAALLKSPHLEHIDVLKVMKGTAGRTACARLERRFGARLTILPNR